jgi:hypothetical protein
MIKSFFLSILKATKHFFTRKVTQDKGEKELCKNVINL